MRVKSRMEFRLSSWMILQLASLMFLCSADQNGKILPKVSPDAAPQPFLPFMAPSPLVPFINKTSPILSGRCSLNLTASDNLIQMTSYDCWTGFAPLLANVMCCPQLDATLTILLGQSSNKTGFLALTGAEAIHCLSDVEQILLGKGASNVLRQICTVHPSNLTAPSCPVKEVKELESMVDSFKLVAACEKVDPVKECCERTCQNAIFEAAKKIASKAAEPVSDNSAAVNDCRNVVLRWLTSKLDPYRANKFLRGLTSCKVNGACPLVFPHMRHVETSCRDGVSNQTGCCNAMESYLSHLQKQTLITNLQALDCASSLGSKLQKLNITRNIFTLCRISLKDFSLQVGSQVSGCLLPSLPSDATFDNDSGISFTCDLNDNIPAPWPSASALSSSSCNKTIRIPALPAAASAQNSLYSRHLKDYATLALSVVLMMLLS